MKISISAAAVFYRAERISACINGRSLYALGRKNRINLVVLYLIISQKEREEKG